MLPLLEIKNLQISFSENEGSIKAVSGSSFIIPKGKMTAIVGESGSGKSVTALSLLQLLPQQANISGEILFSDDKTQVDLNMLSEKEINKIRGNKIAMIFQEPMTSLNPVYTCGYQVIEALIQHRKMTKKKAAEKTVQLFDQVSLPDPAAMLKRFPHELSGGQKQRVMIAMAMSCDPSLLIADEPTTALDVRVQKSILELIKDLQQKNKLSVLLITHDLALVGDFADEIIVMYKGEIVEKGNTKDILVNPQHNYTRALLACKPSANSKGKRLPVINDFLDDNAKIEIINAEELPQTPAENKDEKVLAVEDLHVHFAKAKNIFGKITAVHKAVDGVSFTVNKNETVGLVGESGCGKTTLGRAILHLIKPTSGKIILDGKDISKLDASVLRLVRKDLQIVFQDPYGSLNPRVSIGDAIMEPLNVHHIYATKKQRKEKVAELLEKVSLNADQFNRYPHQFSGGQRQRICIARALALNPSFLVFDESVSALDVSVQAQVLNLINDLKAQLNFTSIFISHDLSVVHYISDRIMVMNKGKIIEQGNAGDVYFNPQQTYTQQLIAAIPGKNKR